MFPSNTYNRKKKDIEVIMEEGRGEIEYVIGKRKKRKRRSCLVDRRGSLPLSPPARWAGNRG